MKTLQINNLPQLPFDVTEAMNQLRINLGFCGSDIKVIMITSSTPNEGKSFIAINLWRMIAEIGSKVLLVDCDLRNSTLRTKYGFKAPDQIEGIAHYLSGKLHDLDETIYQTNIENGYIIPLGTAIANPSILLEGPRFCQMIQTCKAKFDYVIVDTPPLANVADALNIATHCDGSLLVVRGGETSRKLVVNSLRQLERTGKPLLGTVLNRVDTGGKYNRYYYSKYYRYGQYYYRDDNAKKGKRKK